MTEDLPPDWAIERAIEHAGYGTLGHVQQVPEGYPTTIAFAAYIAAHEEPPVDLLLIEAREIVAQRNASLGYQTISQKTRDGIRDRNFEVQLTLEALKRGIELGKEQSA